MGLEYICEVCGSPRCAFTVNHVGKKTCTGCRQVERAGSVSAKVYRAIGVLEAAQRGYLPTNNWKFKDRRGVSALHAKTKALIIHDRILRGEL